MISLSSFFYLFRVSKAIAKFYKIEELVLGTREIKKAMLDRLLYYLV